MTVAGESAVAARSGAQSLERALAVLDCFETEPDLGVTQLARALDLSVSTTHRLLRALCRGGLVAQDAGSGRYRLAARMVVLGSLASRRLGLDAAQPVLEHLAAETGEGVVLGILDGAHSLVVSCAPGRRDDGVTVARGQRGAVHACAMGKTLLAFDEDAGGPQPLARITPRTITDPTVLALQLNRVRERGWAANDEELVLGVRGVSVPVFDADGGVCAALAIAVPTGRLSRAHFPRTAHVLRSSAEQLHGLLPRSLPA